MEAISSFGTAGRTFTQIFVYLIGRKPFFIFEAPVSNFFSEKCEILKQIEKKNFLS